jgi:hypothetical protein
MSTDIAKYSIELFKPDGEGAGIEEILYRHADLKVARSIYRTRVEQYPGRLIMLCDHARVLARPRPYRGSCSSRRLTNAFCPCAGFRCGNSGRLAMLMAMRGASSRPPGPNGDDLALRGLSLRSVRHDDASVPSFTVKP